MREGALLRGKTAVVTGSSRGIGKAIAIRFAEHGADVVINCHQDVAAGEDVARQVRELGCRSILVHASVAEADGAWRLIETARQEFGRIDILVNNAGITRDGFLMTMSERDWDDVIDTNLKSIFFCSKHASKLMIGQRSGTIILVSSLSGFVGMRGQTNYSASKAGIMGFSRSLAQELARWNIRVNVIAPGWIQTDLTQPVKESVLARYPALLRRLGRPEEVADCAVFLASDMASYITGSVLHVDGGMLAKE